MNVRLPRWLLLVLAIAALGGIAMMFVGAWVSGVTWDEKTHVLMLQTYFQQGWNVTADALLNGAPDPKYIWGVYVYGPVGELVAHMANVVLGNESWGDPTLTPVAYAGRHIGIAAMALAGVAAAAATVWAIVRSWAWALVGAAVLATLPLWVGHGMFNIKDTPVAVGYTIATLGIAVLYREDYRSRASLRVLGLGSLVIGTVLASGTREAMGVPVAAGVVAAGILLWLARLRDQGLTFRANTFDALRRLAEGLGGLIIAYLVLVAIYPKAYINPFVLAWQALVVSARFPFDEAVLTSGTWMDQPPPWTYLPHWFLAQLPVLVIAFGTFFALVWIATMVMRLLGRTTTLNGYQLAMAGAVLVQALLMPALGVALRSNMYNGSRQFLFVVPAAAILATLGVWVVAAWLARRQAGRVAFGVLWAVVALGVVGPLVAQSTLFPYNYVFYNAPTASTPIEGHWPTDYWRASSKELMQRLPAEGLESCGYEQGRKKELHGCSLEPMFTPFLDQRGSLAKEGALGPGEYWYVLENQGITALPSGCRPFDSITRRLFLQEIVIGQIAVCPVPGS